MKKAKRYFSLFLGLSMIGLLVSCASQDRQVGLGASASVTTPEGAEGAVRNSAQVIDDFATATGKSIPPEVLRDAAGIAVIPDLTRAAFIAGGRHGSGVLMTQGQDQWSLPVFMSITGGSLGWQIGISSTDLILVFMNPETISSLEQGASFSLGADASVAAGPVGASADVSTINADVLTYSRTGGAFAGLALQGDRIALNRDRTLDYYAAANAETVRGYYGEEGDQLFRSLLHPEEEVSIQNIPPGAAELKEKLDQLTSGTPGS